MSWDWPREQHYSWFVLGTAFCELANLHSFGFAFIFFIGMCIRYTIVIKQT